MDKFCTNNYNTADMFKCLAMLQLEIHKCYSNFNIDFLNLVQFLQHNLKYNLASETLIKQILNGEQQSLVQLDKVYKSPRENKQHEISPASIKEDNLINMKDMPNCDPNTIENLPLKEKYLQRLNSQDNIRHFQVYYVFKNKIKRMYRIDCMTRKINVSFYHYLKDNFHSLNLNDELLEFFKSNIRYTSREKFQELNKKYPQFTDIYNTYLNSRAFRKLVSSVKRKYDTEYQKLFFRHSFNFLNFYLKEHDSVDNPQKKKKSIDDCEEEE